MDPVVAAEAAGKAWEWTFNLFGNPAVPVVVTPWKAYGLLGVALFSGRWLVQLHYSHMAGKPVTPRIFWVLSMAGSVILLTYFIFSPKQDMVGILSNLFPAFIAAYNLYLDLAHAKRTAAAAVTTAKPPVAAPPVSAPRGGVGAPPEGATPCPAPIAATEALGGQ